MTAITAQWPPYDEIESTASDSGFLAVWRWELTKLFAQFRVRIVAAVCLAAPFLVVLTFHLQSSVPQDTLFGQWVHTSGLAIPLVILSFAGQWVLPMLCAMVAGDIFSSEDNYGTWKTVMTRSRTRGQIFAGKVAAVLTYSLSIFLLLTVASVLAGVVAGMHPLVGLSGQVISPGKGEALVLLSWTTQIGPMLALASLAVLLSVASRNSVVGMGGPVLVALVMQLLTLINLPEVVRAAFITNPFYSWHGFWLANPFYGPLREGLVTSAVWTFVCLDAAWLVFRLRSVNVS